MPDITTVEPAGLKKGLERRHQQGLQQGEAALLLWQIEKRFGADVAPRHRARVQTADSDDLRGWTGRILTAESSFRPRRRTWP